VTSPSAVLRRPDRFYDGYVFDLDGTVYLGKALLPDAGEVIASIRERGCRTVFAP
jgi:ribonucleotide monophosphatase NagD (HAD superfamily)